MSILLGKHDTNKCCGQDSHLTLIFYDKQLFIDLYINEIPKNVVLFLSFESPEKTDGAVN